jgi:putative restriction endonuclease
MPLEEFIAQFSRLNTDRGRYRWSADTCNRAPHKPFLLLSIMDLIAQGLITENFIEPSFELVDTWNGYWNAVMPIGQQSTMAHPFPRLKSDGFWERVCNPGYDPDADYNVTSMVKLRDIYAGARLDDELFQFMEIQDSQEKLRATLVGTYFSPEVQPKVIEQGYVNLVSYKYSQTLISQTAAEQVALFDTDVEPGKKKKVRDAGFRKAIVSLYEHRCALCGIRMLTPEGHTVVEAAHIVPWSESQDDQPTNGLCLCRICHWSFDEGLMSV